MSSLIAAKVPVSEEMVPAAVADVNATTTLPYRPARVKHLFDCGVR